MLLMILGSFELKYSEAATMATWHVFAIGRPKVHTISIYTIYGNKPLRDLLEVASGG